MQENRDSRHQSILTSIFAESSDVTKIDQIRDRIAAIGQEIIKSQTKIQKGKGLK